MLICTKRWRQSDDEKFKYEVYDTKDGVSEVADVNIIKSAFDNGFSILGLKQNYKKSIAVDLDFMYYKQYKAEGYYEIDLDVYNDITVLRCNKYEIRRRVYFDYIFIKDDSIVGKIQNVPELDTRNNSALVVLRYLESKGYKGHTILNITLSYLDKHYYHEDSGAYFSQNILIYNNQIIAKTEFTCDDDGDGDFWCEIPDNCGKFEWCCKTVNLDMYL